MTNTLDRKPSTPLPRSRNSDFVPVGEIRGANQHSPDSKEIFRAIKQMSEPIIRCENIQRTVLESLVGSPMIYRSAIVTWVDYISENAQTVDDYHYLAPDEVEANVSESYVQFHYTEMSNGSHAEDTYYIERHRQSSSGNLNVTKTFLKNVRQLDQRGHTDEALDFVFDQLDEMMLAHEFERVDNILAEIATSDFSIDLLIGFLTVTLPAKKHLGKRAEFFARVQSEFEKRGEETVSLLVGLD